MNGINEIGGYFGLESFGGKEYHRGLIGVSSGRGALLCLIRARGIKKLYIPYFLCDSVSELCKREGVATEFYSVGRDLRPVFGGVLCEGEWLYVVNFYGQLADAEIRSMKEKHGRIILDNVQAFFARPLKGVDTVYSCRKFFGVPDGGYVSTDAKDIPRMEIGKSAHRMSHVLGRIEDGASSHYGEFKANDKSFVNDGLCTMSTITKNILCGIDYDAVRIRRNENYAHLSKVLGQKNGITLRMPDGPYCYPFYCEGGMEIKHRLAENKIYVPTLWPNVIGSGDTTAEDLAKNILPLPCDQRYGEAEMDIIAEAVLELIK